MAYGYIYKITNNVNDLIYIGATRHTIDKRFINHNGFTNPASKISKAISEFGKNNFNINLIKTCHSKEQLMYSEKYFIMTYKSNNPEFGFNISTGGTGVRGGELKQKRHYIIMHVTPETKEAIVEKAKKEDRSESYIAGKILDTAIFNETIKGSDGK